MLSHEGPPPCCFTKSINAEQWASGESAAQDFCSFGRGKSSDEDLPRLKGAMDKYLLSAQKGSLKLEPLPKTGKAMLCRDVG